MPATKLPLAKTLQNLLKNNTALGTQEELVDNLTQQGYTVTQSSISRLLRKIGAIKTLNAKGKSIYQLPSTPPEPRSDHTISALVLNIVSNEQLIVIQARPGSASLIASLLDSQRPGGLIGTVAGDDTILVIPHSSKATKSTILAIRELLGH